jgi:hypothetical protein
MSISRIVPPIDYLQEASRSSLQHFELTRLNHAANLRREIGALIDQWIKETSEAMLARWMMDHQESMNAPPLPGPDIFQAFLDAGDDALPESRDIPKEVGPAPPRLAGPRDSASASSTRRSHKHRSGAAHMG